MALAFHRHSMKSPSWKWGCNGDESCANKWALNSLPHLDLEQEDDGVANGSYQSVILMERSLFLIPAGTVTCVCITCSLSQKEESSPKVLRYQHQNTPDLDDLQMELLKPKGMSQLPKLNRKRKCWGHLTSQRAFSWPISSTNASSMVMDFKYTKEQGHKTKQALTFDLIGENKPIITKEN